MAAEVVRLANENRIETTGRPVDEQVQDFMRANLVKAAERPPAPAQVERDRQIAASLGQPEPHHENALESSLYAAQCAPNRSELLNDFTDKSETVYAKQQTQAHELDQSPKFHSWNQSDDYSIGR